MKLKRILVIALSAVVLLVVAGALIIPRALRNFFYPPAPPMPAVVSQSTEQLLAQLEAAMKRQAPLVLEQFQPGLSEEAIGALERQKGVQLPAEFHALYRWHNGTRSLDPRTEGPIPGHRFVPLDEALGLRAELSNQVAQVTVVQRTAFNVLAGHTRSWICLLDDGCGDGYFFDPQRKPEQGALFYHFSQDATYVFFPSVRNLLAGTLQGYQTGVFFWTNEPTGAHLEEDYNRSQKLWDQFGASNIR